MSEAFALLVEAAAGCRCLTLLRYSLSTDLRPSNQLLMSFVSGALAAVVVGGGLPVLVAFPVDVAVVPVVLPASVVPAVEALVDDALVDGAVEGGVDGVVDGVVDAADPVVLGTDDISHRVQGAM
jgi:hypothetical protein